MLREEHLVLQILPHLMRRVIMTGQLLLLVAELLLDLLLLLVHSHHMVVHLLLRMTLHILSRLIGLIWWHWEGVRNPSSRVLNLLDTLVRRDQTFGA